MQKELEERLAFIRSMEPVVKRRGSLSTPARQWVEKQVRHNIERVNELRDAMRPERKRPVFALFT